MKQLFIYISILIICVFNCFFLTAQTTKKIRLIYKSSDIKKINNDTFDIKRVRSATFSDSIVVRLNNKKKIVLAPGKIWGYEDDDSTFYRYDNGEFYCVRQIDTLIIYSRNGGKYSSRNYYFSRGAEGKLLSLSWRNLKIEFAADTCFLNKMSNELKWYQDYSSYNNKTNCYRMIEFFKLCLEKH